MNPRRVALLTGLALMGMLFGFGQALQVLAAPPPPFQMGQDLPNLVQRASLIIVGKVVDVKAGRVAGEGEARLEFDDVRVSVEKRLKGEAPAEVVVELVSQKRRVVIFPQIGPPYKPDERYVLFLTPGEGGRFVAIVPRGRLFLEGGRVGPLDMDEAKFIEEIQTLVRGQN